MTIVSCLKHQNTQPIYIFNRENPKNSEPQNGPRRGLDFIALISSTVKKTLTSVFYEFEIMCCGYKWVEIIVSETSRLGNYMT